MLTVLLHFVKEALGIPEKKKNFVNKGCHHKMTAMKLTFQLNRSFWPYCLSLPIIPCHHFENLSWEIENIGQNSQLS